MARRIATTRTTRLARILGAGLVAVSTAFAPALAQNGGGSATPAAPDLVSKACQPGASAGTEASPLPHVAAALAQRKTLRILALGAAPGRVGARGGYTAVIEGMLERAIKDVDVVMINRGVSGELAANAAHRMRNEVALEQPDLVLWQVGTNDALAYVPAADFAAVVKEQIDWLKAHNVDVVLVGLQFAKEMLRDAHYVEVREALRKVAAQENVIMIRFLEAVQIVNQASGGGPVAEAFAPNEAGYSCLAQYVARAITLGVFAKNMPRRP